MSPRRLRSTVTLAICGCAASLERTGAFATNGHERTHPKAKKSHGKECDGHKHPDREGSTCLRVLDAVVSGRSLSISRLHT